MSYCPKCNTPTYETLVTGVDEWYHRDACPMCEDNMDELEALDAGLYEGMIITDWLCQECGSKVFLSDPLDGNSSALKLVVCIDCEEFAPKAYRK